jgi:23S rRNA (cytosine1962-C5)-methyltransferase
MATTTPTSYSLLDFGNGGRLEQWGPYRLVRPDPAAQGRPAESGKVWDSADATYVGQKGRGGWQTRSALPPEWPVEFDDLRLLVRLTPYKHTGVFPEQLQNWRWARSAISRLKRQPTVLNLFAYTGGATVALAKQGAFVTHVDASRPAISWAKQNAALNELPGDRVRWILDDVPAFVARERRRGRTYDAIVLDPPAFGHSPEGRAWRVERDLPPLLENCCALLSPRPAFVLLNGYARNERPDDLGQLVRRILRGDGAVPRFDIDARELLLAASDGRTLSTGVVARCAYR